jgi:hypothetical protein
MFSGTSSRKNSRRLAHTVYLSSVKATVFEKNGSMVYILAPCA